MTSALRIAFVADIHHGQDNLTKKGSAALGLIDEFCRFVAEAQPDLVVDLGDRISDENRNNDLRLEREIAEALRPIRPPLYHICGNHDRENLSVADNEGILGQPLGHQTVDIGGWRLVLWRADTLLRPGGYVLMEDDLLWLSAVVNAADRPLLVMSHIPISGHSQIGNYYFERNPLGSTYHDAARARATLRQARVPVVWVSGHVHWNTYTPVDGIAHLTLQSLTECFTTSPDPAGAWALLELGSSVNLRVFGKDPLELKLDMANLGRRWVTPLGYSTEEAELGLARKPPSPA